MSRRTKKLLFLAAIVAASFYFGRRSHAGEFHPQTHFVTEIVACEKTHCETFRRATDADNEVECQIIAATQSAAAWAKDHPTWSLRAWRCVKSDDVGI